MRNPVSKAIELDPERAPIVRQLFELYAGGDKSIDDALAFAKSAGLRYPRTGRCIARSEVDRLLKKPFYTGRFSWNKTVYQGEHPALVDGVLFERVQAAFRRRKPGRYSRQHFVFGDRLISCAECGLTVTAELKKQRFVYYHCTAFTKKHKPVYVPEPLLDAQFADVIKRMSLPRDWDPLLKDCLEAELGKSRARAAGDRERLESAREKLRNDMRKAFQAKIDGLVTDDLFRDMQKEYQSQLESLEFRLANLDSTTQATLWLQKLSN